MNKVLFFCHAPADVQFIISQIEQNKEKEISVIVINVENIYRFFQNINLHLNKLLFISYRQINFKNPFQLLSERKRLRHYYRQNLEEFKDAEVFFYTLGYDWISFYFLKKLAINNKVSCVDYSKHKIKRISKLSSPQWFNRFVISIITGMKLDYVLRTDINVAILKFNINSYGIKTTEPYLNREYFKKYTYKYPDIKAPSVLILDPNVDKYDIYVSYEARMKVILDIIKDAGYHIYVKSHPRLGHSTLIETYATGILTGEIPSEFLDVSDFTLAIKIDSYSVFAAHNNNVWSIIDLIEYVSDDLKQVYRKFIQENDNNNLQFFESLEELKTMLNKLSHF